MLICARSGRSVSNKLKIERPNLRMTPVTTTELADLDVSPAAENVDALERVARVADQRLVLGEPAVESWQVEQEPAINS